MNNNGVVESDFKGVFQGDVYIERSKLAIKLARVKQGLTINEVVDGLKERGIAVGQSTISKYEKLIAEKNSLVPSMEYIIGLHMITGVSMNVLCGINEWGDEDIKISEETEEIVRMINNMSSHYREMAETILYVIYANEHAETIEEIREIILRE